MSEHEFEATAEAQSDQQEMREICAQSIVGMKPTAIVHRLTSDMLRMGYPVPNPNAEYTPAKVADLTAFLSR